MLGILVILAVSALLLWFIEKKSLLVLGPLPIVKRLGQFAIGFAVFLFLRMAVAWIEWEGFGIAWELKSEWDWRLLWKSLGYHSISALTEDLVFRGALLYILIQRIGARWAMLLSAAVFGVYHWFSYGILGEGLLTLVVVFVMTGFMGWAWAYAFHRTKSIFLGFGLHLGSNYAMSLMLDGQPYGELLFTTGEGIGAGHVVGVSILLLKVLVLPFTAIILVRLLTRSGN